MKRLFAEISIMLLAMLSFSCNGESAKRDSDTVTVPSTTDTMPVLHPKNLDSGSAIKTPPANDDNAIMPDSAIKNK